MSIRTIRRACAGAIAAMLLGTAHADAPAPRTQAPGYYRMLLGDFELTALSDGTVGLHVEQLLTNTTKRKVESALARWRLMTPVETSVNGYLVNTGSKLVLVDAGAGGLFGPTLGKLVANLKAAGYQPEQVDEVYITHMHPDHVGGLVADGKPVFANAVVRADKADADFWLSPAELDAAPKESKGFFQGAMASLKPYVDAGRFQAIEGDVELVPGIRAVATHGHTKGHRNYVVESGGQSLVLWGDLMHVAAVQFANPRVTIQFDTDPKAAMAQRRKAYAEAAKRGHWVGGAHLSFPGLGHLRADGRGYEFQPANYSALNKP